MQIFPGKFSYVTFFRWAFTFLCLFLLAIQLNLYFQETRSWKNHPSNPIMEKTCSDCHDPGMPHRYAKSPMEWQMTVERMTLRKNESVPEDVKAKIADLLIDLRSADGATLFKLRCGRCHSTEKLDPYLGMSRQALEIMLNQHIQQNNFAVQKWEGELIIAKVRQMQTERFSENAGALPDSAQVLYQKTCGTCHTISFIYRDVCDFYDDDAAIKKIILRMIEKSPKLADQNEIHLLHDFSKKLCTIKKPAS